MKLNIHDASPQDTKSRSLRNSKILFGSSCLGSRVISRSRRWSSGSLYSDIFDLNELSLSMLDAEVIGIISMEDIIGELLKVRRLMRLAAHPLFLLINLTLCYTDCFSAGGNI